MRPLSWKPPIEPSCVEQTIITRIKRAKLFVFLRHHRHELFDDAFQEELTMLYAPSLRGQPPIPPAQLALATIVQAYTGVSADEVIEATLMDRRWQLVLNCLDTDQAPFSKGTFVAFRKRLIDPRWIDGSLNGRSRLPAKITSLDHAPYTPHWTVVRCGELAESRIRTISSDTRSKRSCVWWQTSREGSWRKWPRRRVRKLVCGTSLKAALDRDWDQQREKEEALSLVLQVLQTVEAWLPTLTGLSDQAAAQDPLKIAKQVREQDVQMDEQGKASLIKGVAKDRRISVEDAEMRHGRKSRSVRVDGYKRHV